MTTIESDIVEILSEDEDVSNLMHSARSDLPVQSNYRHQENDSESAVKTLPVEDGSYTSGIDEENHIDRNDSSVNEGSADYMKRRRLGSIRLDSLTRPVNPTFPNVRRMQAGLIREQQKREEQKGAEQKREQNNSLDMILQDYLNKNSSSESLVQNRPGNIDSTVEIISITSDDDEEEEEEDLANNNKREFGKIRQDNNSIMSDSDSDDEIVILDADEATRSRKFKETSFERNSRQISHHIWDTTPVNDPRMVIFNQPVPAPDFSIPQSYENVIQSEKNSRLEIYETERPHVISRLSNLSKERDNYSDSVKSLSNTVTDLNNHLDTLKYHSDERSKELYTSIVKTIHEKKAALHNAKQILEHTVANFNAAFYRLQVLDEARGNLRDDSRRNNQNSLNFDRSASVKPELNLVGFSKNVYTSEDYSSSIYTRQSEEEYLQDLLNNIRPDDELAEKTECTPSDLSINLLRHQQMGLSWLLRMEDSKSKGGILADDMGLGKTIQAIALIMANKSDDPYVRTTLIIAPVSLLRQWAAEIESKVKPSSKISVAIFHGQEKKRLSTYMSMRKYDVIMTSYGTLSSEWKKHYKEALEESVVKRTDNVLPDLGSGGRSYNSPFFSEDAKFYRIILDEAQNIKNKLSIASKAAACLKGTYRFCLSGTPIQNNIEELFPIIRFLKIKPYNNEYKFRNDIALPLKSKGTNYDSSDKQGSMKKLRAILKAILLRRNKDSIIDGKPILSLPEKHIIKDNVQMDKDEREYYSSLEAGIQKKAERLLAEKKQGIASNFLTLLLRLRQACCHKFLVELGSLKQQESEKYNAYNPRDSTIIYRRIKSLDSSIIASVKDRANSPNFVESGVFSCPLCFDVSSYDSVVLFPACGHMICKYCIDSFFSNNEIGDAAEDNRLASCFDCKKTIKESDLIEFHFYSKIVDEKLSEIEFSNYYDKIHAPKSRTSNNSLIQDLIKSNKGFSPSAKMLKCVELLQKVFIEFPKEKVIIFSQFTSLFDLMKLLLDENEIPFLRYDGSMSMDDKNATIKKFYQDDSKKVLLLSLRAGNVGLTLTCASHVIIMDPFWNPYVEEQAMDRAYRIGQQREVHVHRILIEGTVESRIMELQEMKKEMVDAALDENSMKSVSRLGQRELGFLFGLNSLR